MPVILKEDKEDRKERTEGTPERPRRIPPAYSDATKTPLKAEVKPGEQTINLELKSPDEDKPANAPK